jgi:hypothetical protein
VAEGRSATEHDGKEVRVVDDRSVYEDSISSEDAVSTTGGEENDITDGINLKMLKSLLKSFGSIRLFSLVKDADLMKVSAFLPDMYLN